MPSKNSDPQSAIRKLESQISDSKAKLAKLRQAAGPELVKDYVFQDSHGRDTKLSSLFGRRDQLILIHNMGKVCSSCTMWADGFNGLLKHLEDRAAFVVETPDAPDIQRRFGQERGWKFHIVSSRGTAFRKDMGYADKQGDPQPGVSTFQKDKSGRLFRVAHAMFDPGDDYCSTWGLFDLLPGGSKGWNVKFGYYP